MRGSGHNAGVVRGGLVENAVYRYKTIIGRRTRSRTMEGQRVQEQLACGILNTIPLLGMPDSYRGSDFRSGDGESVFSSEPCTNVAER